MKLPGIIFLLAVLSASAARAQAPDASCGNDFSSEKSIGLAKVVGADHLVFLKDTDGCPSEAAACRQRAYVVGGDQLLTSRTVGPYVCALFPNRLGGNSGWVQTARLTPLPVNATPAPAAWAGHWADGDDTIGLAVKGAALVADGNAYYPSAHPPAAQFPGGPNVGELEGTAAPTGNRVVFTDNDPNGCTATLTLVGGMLVVADNGGCGGQNVSFSGVYTRK